MGLELSDDDKSLPVPLFAPEEPHVWRACRECAELYPVEHYGLYGQRTHCADCLYDKKQKQKRETELARRRNAPNRLK